MSLCRLILWCALILALFTASPTFGQRPAEQPAPQEETLAPGEQEDTRAVRESGPPVTYLKNKEGKLILVPSLPLEEYERLMQLDRGLPSRAPPRFTFAEVIELSGSVTDSVAELTAKLTIRFTPGSAATDEWVRIPLRFQQAVLTSAITDQEGAEVLTEFQSNGDGYVVWARLPQKADLKLKLNLKLPIASTASEKRFLLSVPNWTTNLRLSVASPDAEGQVDEESGCELSRVKSGDGRTEFLVVGSGGSVKFTWHDTREPPPVLESEGNFLVKLAGRGFDVDAHLRVRSLGPPIDSFSVRLPPGAKLIPKEQADVQVSEVSSGQPAGFGQLVLVRRLDGKTSNPIEVRLKTTAGSTGTSQLTGGMETAGFQVTAAQIQRGTVDFTLDGEWSVDWKGDVNVRRVDVPEALRPQQVVARFEFDRQPFSLKALVGKGVPRINAEPTYVVTVDAEQLKLNGSIRYRISGARVDKLRIETGGWIVDRVGPPDLIGGPWITSGAAIEVPLSSAALVGRGEFELQLEAHHAVLQPALSAQITRGTGVIAPGLLTVNPATGEPWIRYLASGAVARDVRFELPHPSASGATPGLVVISPADNVELTPVNGKLHGLVPDVLPAQVTLPTRQQPPLVFREDGVGETSQFQGLLKTRRQAITVDVENRVTVEEREIQVEQLCHFTIAYEPAETLKFDVPRSQLSGGLEALLDGSPVLLTLSSTELDTESERALVSIDLHGKRLGKCDITFRQRVPHSAFAAEKSNRVALTLVRPVESESTQIKDTSLRLTSSPTIGVSLLDERSIPIADKSAGSTMGHDLSYQLDDVPPRISVAMLGQQAASRRSTRIQRIWVQALLGDSERRDRACFRLNTNESKLSFKLPVGIDPNGISVVVDGQQTDRPVMTSGTDLSVELGESTGRRDITIELWYWFTAQPALLGRLSLQAPALIGGSHADRVYWELSLPSNEHLAWTSRSLVTENTWHWQRMFLAREPNLTQSELEQWVHANSRGEDAGFNRYLFSSVGAVGPNTIVTIMRPFALLLIAGAVFAAGTVLLYVPSLRHPLLMSAAGLLLMSAAISFPEPALAAAQAVVIGLTLVLVARLLQGVMVRQPAPRMMLRGSTFIVSDARSSKSGPRRSEVISGAGPSPISTQPQPLQVSAMGHEP